jgi:hypothetical protein
MAGMIRSLLLLFLLIVLFSPKSNAQTINAASCSQADIVTALGSVTADGTTVAIPSCNATWSGSVTPLTVGTASVTNAGDITYNPAYSIIIQGQTSCTGSGSVSSPISCTDSTNIDLSAPGAASSNTPISITTSTGKSLRITGMSFNWASNPSAQATHGGLGIQGTSTSVRIDHSHFNTINFISVQISEVYGVFDHDLLENNSGTAIHTQIKFIDSRSDGNGDVPWSQATSLGTANSIYVENSTFSGNNFGDCYWGGRYVLRFDTFNGTPVQTHPTTGGSRARGCRQWEVYENTFSNTGCSGTTCSNADFISSGTGLLWGNTIGSSYSNFVTLHCDICDNQTYYSIPAPNGFGFAGQFWSGTVNTNGTAVTSTSSNKNSAPFGFTLAAGNGNGSVNLGALAGEQININGTLYTVASFNSATSITLTTSAGTQTGVTYYVPSNWSKLPNTATGGMGLDMPGTGKADLLTGSFPNTIDSVTKMAAWPNQNLEPIYEWLDNSSAGTLWSNFNTATLLQNTEYYLGQTSGCSGAQTTGVCSGTLASRPTTCTAGVGYWATDQGNWNQSGSGGQGELFVCGAGNTWSLYYEPYTYPHPLVSGTGGSGAPAAPTNLSAIVN